MIYKFIRYPISFALRQFFSDIIIRGERQCEDSPVLIVANHPNLALDSLIIGASFKRELWFMAKSTLFRNPILKKFFTACNMVPVYRKMDYAEGAPSNDETFRLVAETLSNGRAVVIFPEGKSVGERKLSPIKTGAARIVFQAEEAKNFLLGVKVQPIGLTYSELDKFRSRVTLTIGQAINVSDYKDLYTSDAIGAVQQLTQKIEQGLRAVTVEVEDLRHTELVEKITALYTSRFTESKEREVQEPEIMQIAASNVSAVSRREPELAAQIENRIDQYLSLAQLFSVREDSILKDSGSGIVSAIYLPLVLFGVILNFIPYKLVTVWVSRMAYKPVYHASLKFGVGFLVFSFWYIGISVLAAFVSKSLSVGLLTLIIIVWISCFTIRHTNRCKLWMLSYLWPGKKKPLEVLKMIRDQLVSELDSLRVQ